MLKQVLPHIERLGVLFIAQGSMGESRQLNLPPWLWLVTGQRKKRCSLICILLYDITAELISTNYKSWSPHEDGPSAAARTNMKIAATGSHVEWDRGCKPEIRTKSLNSAPLLPQLPQPNSLSPSSACISPEMKYSWGRLQQQAAARTCCKWTPLNAACMYARAICSSSPSVQPPTHTRQTHTHTHGEMRMWYGGVRGYRYQSSGKKKGGDKVQVITVERKKQIHKGRKIQYSTVHWQEQHEGLLISFKFRKPEWFIKYGSKDKII